jgi:hypothetical protein
MISIMKKILSLIFLTVILVGNNGCKDFLEPEFKTDIILTNYGNTPTEANLILNQAYVDLRDNSLTGSVYWQFFTTDYSVPPAATSLSLSNIAKMSYDATDGEIFSIWTAHYRAISRPNFLIEKTATNLAKQPSATDAAAWTKIDAEARFLRAFSYFNLVRLFRNVPIITQYFTKLEDINNVSNATGDKMKEQEAKVYDLIIADLDLAIKNLPDASDVGRCEKGAAQALLAKVYLTRASIAKHRDKTGEGTADYQKVIDLTAAIMNSKRYALKQYYPDNFIRDKQHSGANETIFWLEFNETDNSPTRVGLSTGYLNNSTSTVEVGTVNGANGGQLPTDFGWSVFDLNSPGDLVRRFWTFEDGEFQRYDANGNRTLQLSAADCPGDNCEIFLRSSEPYPWNRPYWFELINDVNAFRSNPTTADVVTNPATGQTWFSTIWGGGTLSGQPGLRLVKYRRNPLTQANYTVNSWDGDLPILRYSELLLMYAEAANELVGPTTVPTGGTLTALAVVNQIRDRARNFTYYTGLTTTRRIIDNGPYRATYGDIFSRKAKVGATPPPATTENAADTLTKYYNQISAFRGLREVPASPDIRNFKDFPATANFVPDFPNTLTRDQFREDLLDERWRELAGEQNMRWYDLTRYGRLVSRISQYKSLRNPLTNRTLTTTPFGTTVLNTPDAKFEYLPIPQSEINRNGKLNQNAGF